MKKYLGRILIILILVGAGLLFAKYYYKPKTVTSNRHTTLKYSTFIKEITFSGIVTPIRQAKIVAPYSGYIKKLYVKIGQAVQKGDPIVSITESLHTDEKVYPMRAPYQGTVVSVPYVEGEFVRKGDAANPVVRIDDLHKFYVAADVSELDILKIKIGQEAKIQVLSISHKTYQGAVSSIAMAPKSRRGGYTRSHSGYPIKIEILHRDDLLKPGMSAVVKIILSKKDSILKLPYEFVLKLDSKYYVILKNGKRIPVTIGAQTGNEVIIKHGVPVGSVVQQVDYFDNQDRPDGAS